MNECCNGRFHFIHPPPSMAELPVCTTQMSSSSMRPCIQCTIWSRHWKLCWLVDQGENRCQHACMTWGVGA